MFTELPTPLRPLPSAYPVIVRDGLRAVKIVRTEAKGRQALRHASF